MIAAVDMTTQHEVFAALGDPTRVAILGHLRARDLCVCHLVERLGLKQSIVSHHVGILRRAGLITSQPNPSDRRWLYYRLNRVALESLASQVDWLLDATDYDPTPLPCSTDTEHDAE